jgi:hypothetical protein
MDYVSKQLTKNEAKCSDVITALKPTTGTKAAKSVPKTTCIEMSNSIKTKKFHLCREDHCKSSMSNQGKFLYKNASVKLVIR